jgi:hypothetical protein
MADPVSEQQRAWAQSTVRRRSWIGVAAGIVAIAAALLFVIVRPPPRDLTSYQIDGPHGLVKIDRAGTQTDRVTPESRISLRLLPPEASDEAIFASVYSVEGRTLRRASAKIEARRGVFAIEVTGRELFGDAFGPRRMVVVLATDEADLDAPDLSQPGLRSWSFDLSYEPRSGP